MNTCVHIPGAGCAQEMVGGVGARGGGLEGMMLGQGGWRMSCNRAGIRWDSDGACEAGGLACTGCGGEGEDGGSRRDYGRTTS